MVNSRCTDGGVLGAGQRHGRRAAVIAETPRREGRSPGAVSSDASRERPRVVWKTAPEALIAPRPTWNLLDKTTIGHGGRLCTVCVTVWKTLEVRSDGHHTLCHPHSNCFCAHRYEKRTLVQVNQGRMPIGETVSALSYAQSSVDNCVDRAVHPCG